MTIWVVIGLICLVVGGGLLYWRSRTMRDLGLMARLETSTARDAAARPPGTLVEVKGVVRCETPLQSEYARLPCVYYSAAQTERYVVHDQDSQGRPRRREESRTVYSNTRSMPFLVEDASGAIRVTPVGGRIEPALVFDQTQAAGGLSASLTLGDVMIGGPPIDQTWRESAIAIDAPVYVLGVVQQDRSVGPPEHDQRDAMFVISVKSEEQRAADEAGKARWLMLFAALSLVAGVACLMVPRLLGIG